jgi:NADH:ubiquinone oxidoreductase subunit 5 (subunit L)/multisubunit Na+/H+ antiporter MnhA subunit
MWPFHASMQSVWLALYLATWALHAVFVSCVAIGSGYALLRKDELSAKLRDWLPFMLGAGITAGVAPLLVLQLLYQRRFYTANLLMGPRWGAVVPALIIGFYALYLAKASDRWRRPALAIGCLCFGFVAWSWTEIHQLMLADTQWRAMYAAGDRIYGDPAVIPRLAMWLGCMTALFALVASYASEPRGEQVPLGCVTASRRLAILALAGIGIATLVYLRRPGTADRIAARFSGPYKLLLGKYFIDELYDETVVQPIKKTSTVVLWRGMDAGLVDGTVNGVGLVVRGWSAVLRRMQTGSVRAYAMSLFVGVVAIVGYFLWR